MSNLDNIEVVGTSHIAQDSVNQVRKKIEEQKPEIVCVELDPGRAYSLKHKKKRPKNIDLLRSVGVFGFLFFLVGEFIQKRLGKIVELDPGTEMLTALNAAEKNNCKIFLIDRDINITIKRLSKKWKKIEILKMIFDFFKGLFVKEERIEFDLSRLPSEKIIEKVLEDTKKKYPSLFKILVDERDRYMARNLLMISKKYPEEKIIAVVGAGHKKGIRRYLDKLEGNF